MTSNYNDLVTEINSKDPFTGFTAEVIHEGYADLPTELLIPIPDYIPVTSVLEQDADFRLVTAIELLHMEYLDATGTYEVTSNLFNAASGSSISLGLDTDLEKL